MTTLRTLVRCTDAANRHTVIGWPLLAGVAALLTAQAPMALAADGCKVLLCLAAPSWRSIPQCVPPVNEVLRDLARGRPFPVCDMSGPGNSATHQWSSAPSYCPAQYTRAFEGESGSYYSCGYFGAISVTVDGALWARTWWSFNGDTVTEFTSIAKARLGTWDTRFDDDFAAWVDATPPSSLP